MTDLIEELEKLRGRDLQLYAAACLRDYCEIKAIHHIAIDELLEHLMAYPTASPISNWQQQGALLALNGRGDELPQSLAAQVKANDLQEFSTLVDSAVEVGIVDLYGAHTESPLQFLLKMLRIFEKNRFNLPARP